MRVLVISLLAVLLAGCNTVTGLGKDIQQGGEALERAGKK